MRLKTTDLADFRRRRARAQPRKPLPRGSAIKVPLRANGERPEFADILVDIHGGSFVIDKGQAVVLAQKLLDAAAQYGEDE